MYTKNHERDDKISCLVIFVGDYLLLILIFHFLHLHGPYL